MVRLNVLTDNVVNFRGINNRADTVQQLFGEVRSHRINEGHFLINNQIRIIGATFRSPEAKEVAEHPVNGTHPVHAFHNFNFFSSHG